MMRSRLERLRAAWDEGVDAYLITQPQNRRYLSGFTGSDGALLVTRDQALVVTDFRYWDQVRAECAGWQLVEQRGAWKECLADLISEQGWSRVALEADVVTLRQKQLWQQAVDPAVQWVEKVGTVEALRAIKDEAEQAAIARAVELADRGFDYLLGFLRPGVTEREVAIELEFFLRRQGAQGISFDFIVASGARGALPHGVASNKVLAEGDMVTFDYGCVLDGYCSDTTRTVVLGSASPEQRRVYSTVLEAQLAALAGIRAGVTGQAVDRLARDVIERAGYGERFGHGTGHGVGLVVHEAPRLSPLSSDTLESGQVVTVEPGIYLPGWGGVRIEDMVIVRDGGCMILTQAPKELMEIR
ncbi:M24 family metallopeptidase [Heliophilum fasciatum]|uniref:Xaa-Pro aminopeptidase/Xaa-Pro dipeptidase n=1 Tax=Heliophilum fasciatum TaxID=35700 RepID=A0A4V2SXQ3_9FIRM|nr:aminopeptidase P family protein [Heliophilum fasciatum]MCW2277319.1 Xaa-Pro aminopeptidase [Heliophilum fasciatum]TCP67156.1 Xaa-Pro aminopeptidase/Xaa-Pro dipeptidase [Heliophilum fasciatum]